MLFGVSGLLLLLLLRYYYSEPEKAFIHLDLDTYRKSVWYNLHRCIVNSKYGVNPCMRLALRSE